MEPHPTLEAIYDSWRGHNQKLRDAIAPLTSQQLDLQPAPHMWPVSQLAQHIIAARAGWFGATLQEADAAMDNYMNWGQRGSPERSGAELASALDATFAFIEACMRRWTPEDCAQTFPDEMDGQITMVSRAWVIYHVLEHDLHHGGEISLILGANRIPAIDL